MISCSRAAFWAALACAGAAALPAMAFDTLRFRVQGGGDGLAQTLGASSLLVEQKKTGVQNPNDILAAARADYARIVGALYAEGRFGGTVSIRIDGSEAAEIDPLATLASIGTVEVIVRPGPLYRFGQAEIAPVAPGTELPEGFSLGKPARTGVIEEATSAVVEGWQDTGHAMAHVAGQKITANHATETLNAAIAIEPGPVLRFGTLRIEGQSAVSTRRIRKIAGLPKGETYDPAAVDRSARRLRETGAFSSVTLTEADQPNPDGTLDVIAEVVDQKPRRFGFGAELDSSAGLTLSSFWMHRNLRGGAERLRFDAEVSGIGGESGGTDYSLGMELGRPATPNALTDAYIKTGIEHRDEDDYISDSATIGLGFNREINDIASTRYGIEYRYSDVSDASGDTVYQQVFLPLGGTYDKREGILNTNDGYYIDLGISPFFGLDGSESGARLTLDARAFEDYGQNNKYVLAAHLQAGSIVGASVTGLPNELRFTSGGGGTVRGQDYQSLDLDIGGVASGGRSFLGLQTEFRTRVRDDVQLVGFYDWGTVGEGSLPGSSGESHSGAGLGLRYDTGIGPIRFDLAVPVSGPGDNSGFHIYIGIGQAF